MLLGNIWVLATPKFSEQARGQNPGSAQQPDAEGMSELDRNNSLLGKLTLGRLCSMNFYP